MSGARATTRMYKRAIRSHLILDYVDLASGNYNTLAIGGVNGNAYESLVTACTFSIMILKRSTDDIPPAEIQGNAAVLQTRIE